MIKDVIADLRNSVKERDSQDMTCWALEQEELVFEVLKDLKLPDPTPSAQAGQLFRTTLVKSTLSSPMAALETVRNRLQRLEAAIAHSLPADQAALAALVPLLEEIGPNQFSKYQRLIQLVRVDWGWHGHAANDRLVIFTGRRETQRFLMKHLAQDLDLESKAVVSLDAPCPTWSKPLSGTVCAGGTAGADPGGH